MSLIAPRFRAAEYHRTVWSATVEHGVSPDAILNPSFWAHVSGQMKVGDRIEVEIESREWFAELYVMEVGNSFARVRPLLISSLIDMPEAGAKALSDVDFTVEWKGPHRKWCVIRKSDKALIYSDMASKDEANAKLAAHARPLAA